MKKIVLLACLLVVPGTPALGQRGQSELSSIDDYLLDEPFEIALALSAAPAHVGAEATVLVMRRDGYRSVREGSNGFTCLVERSWSVPLLPDTPIIDFWNADIRVPICYNAEASRTILAEYLRRTELALAGKSRTEMKRLIDVDFAEGRLRAPRELAMSYMMSGGQYLGSHPSVGQWKPHVMFYVPCTVRGQLGWAPGTGSYVSIFEHEGGPYSAIVVIVPEFNEAPAPGGDG